MTRRATERSARGPLGQWLRGAATAGLLLTGCASFTNPVPASVMNACGPETRCSDGVCDEALGMCVTEAPVEDQLEIAIQVVPPGDALGPSRPSWTSEPFAVTEAVERDLALPAYADVYGRVRWRGERVAAELIFSRPGLAGRREVRVRTTTFGAPVVVEGEEADFATRLAVGADYHVEVRPTRGPDGFEWRRTLPPWRLPEPLALDLENLALDLENTAERIITAAYIEYPSAIDTPCGAPRREGNGPRTDACKLEGTLLSQRAESDTLQAGLQVRALSPDGLVVSSTSLTSEDGRFAIVLAPGAERWTLRISGGEERRVFPDIDVDPALLFGGDVVIDVPEPTSVRYEGAVESESGELIAGAAVTFLSEQSIIDEARGVTGSFQVSATTDEEGLFALELVPGDYDVIVTPSGVEHAVLTEEVSIPTTTADNVRGQLFALPARTRLGGSVRAPDARPMTGVIVEASALGASEGASYHRSSDAVTYETGQFELFLDQGRYDFFLKPPVESRFGWLIVPAYEVRAVDTVLSERFSMRPPIPVRGYARDASGAPLPDAELRVFGRVPGEERFIEVGYGRADEEGRYEVLLPPSFAR